MGALHEHVAYAVVIARAYERLEDRPAERIVLRGDRARLGSACVVGTSDEVIANIELGDPGWEELAGLWRLVAPADGATLSVDMDLSYRLEPPSRLVDVPDLEEVASPGDRGRELP
jgi:hypothetical protein